MPTAVFVCAPLDIIILWAYNLTDMRKRKFICALLVLSFMPFALSACNKGGDEDNFIFSEITENGQVTGYAVDGFKGDGAADAVIPAEHNGKPVTAIKENAFRGTPIESVTFPESITYVGVNAFGRCEKLSRMDVADADLWCGITFGNVAANPLYFATKFYSGGKEITSVKIPDTVSKVGDFAFYGYEKLESVEIGSGVTLIGESAFDGCASLKSVTGGENAVSVGELAFSGCVNLQTADIGNKVESIGDYAFNGCSSLKRAVIPSSVKSIGECAFTDCSSLESLTLNEGLESIGDCAFGGCTSLTRFDMPSTVNEIGWGMLMFGGGGAGFGGEKDPSNNISEVTISDGITLIPDYAFNSCNITALTIGSSVEEIGYSAFYGCSVLKDVIMPVSVKKVTSYAFYKCSSLEKVFYCGNEEEWGNIKIGRNGNDISSAEIYFYSEAKPQAEGSFWRYVGGKPEIWQ